MVLICRKTFLIFLILFSFSNAFSLELTDLTSSFSDLFSDIIGDNEGTTGFRSLLIPTGGRAESLGGAYTGLSDDISYIDYNPAASAILEQTEISLFHNAWIADSAMETIAMTTRFNNFGIGSKISCFYVPFTEYDAFGTRTTSNYYSETVAAFNAAYNFHPGYNFRGLSVGTSLKIGWRAVPDYTDNDSGELISQSGLEQSALAFMTDLGVLTQFNLFKTYYSRDTNFKLGLSITNLGAAITGFSGTIKADDPLPSSIGIGASYKIIRPLTVSFEFRQPFNLSDLSEQQRFYAGTGIAVDITKFFSVLGGFQIKGGNPRFSMGSEFQLFKMRFNINYTLDLTSSLNPLNRISLSAKIKLGDKGRGVQRTKVDELYSQGLTFYSEKNYQAAIDSWNAALSIDKYFDPARTAIEATSLYAEMLENISILSDFGEKFTE